MNTTTSILLFSISVLLIEIYSEFHLKNFGKLKDRFSYLFGIKSIFNIVKLSLFCSTFYILMKNYLIEGITEVIGVNLNSKWIYIEYWYYYFIPSLCFIVITIFINSQEIHRQLRSDLGYHYEKIDNFLSNIKYSIYRLCSFAFVYFTFLNIFKYSLELDKAFKSNGLTILDWLKIENSVVDNYNKGVYFSLFLSLTITIVLINSFVKISSGYREYREIKLEPFFKYFLISIILFVSLFFGLFSIFNAIFNLLNYSDISLWFSKDNIVGIFPIRISSIILFIYLITYLSKNVFHKSFIKILILGFFPIRRIEKDINHINFNNSSSLFFSQISFYILNLALAEYLIIIGYRGVASGLLSFSLLFIIDDFKIINDYSSGMSRVMHWHFIRIWVINIILFFTSITLLFNHVNILTTLTYILLSTILFVIYFRNKLHINFKYY